MERASAKVHALRDAIRPNGNKKINKKLSADGGWMREYWHRVRQQFILCTFLKAYMCVCVCVLCVYLTVPSYRYKKQKQLNNNILRTRNIRYADRHLL